jgi:type II secretion system protein H
MNVAVQTNTRPRQARGFTLIELVLVLVLLATMLAIAMPAMSGFWTRSRSRDAATQLLALTQFARSCAATEVRLFRLNFNLADNSYWLTARDPATSEFAELGTDMGRHFTLPEGMRLEIERQSMVGAQQAGTVIDFYPNGRADVATLRLTDVRGDVTVISSPSPAEPFRLVTAEEAARR